MRRILAALALACCAASCASAPPVPAATRTALAVPSYDQKMAWILRLEDERILGDPEPPPQAPNLVRLLADADPRIRRRAALAVGRVGLRAGAAPLIALLADTDPEVRQIAAFALGLIGDKSATAALMAALNDPKPSVTASAAEALGLIGDVSAADAIARMASASFSSLKFAEESGLPLGPNGPVDDETRDGPLAPWRLSVYALARLKAYPALASVVLDQSGHVKAFANSWQVAYALGRTEDPRAFDALATLTKDAHPYTRAFAAKGLGALKNKAAVPLLLPLVDAPEPTVRVEAVRALGRIGDASAGPRLLTLIRDPKTETALRAEGVAALGVVGADGALDTMLDFLADRSPLVRAAAIVALPMLDRENFVTTLSGIDEDPDWHVRAALATALGTLPLATASPRLHTMLADPDQRVIPAVLASLAKLHAPDAAQLALDRLKADDPVVRSAAASAIGELKPPSGAEALAQAYQVGQRDPEYGARASALEALVEYGAPIATPVLTTALADKDWAVRRKAAALVKRLDPATDADARIRPAPLAHDAAFYQDPHLASPPISTAVYIDTDRGTIQIELAVVDAPLTVAAFVALAQKQFYDGVSFHRVVPDFVAQAGDPRGDGEGGPGFTIRDELSEGSFLRGTVGMALDGPDTGGSQFFIAYSPAPHLDAKYTIVGRVISGMEIVDQIQQGDVIRRVRVWNGE